MTQSSYLKCHADTLFAQNAEGDLTLVNDWQQASQAPLFYLARGRTGKIYRFHASVPIAVRQEILPLVAEEPTNPQQLPIFADRYTRLLSKAMDIGASRFGPAYCFTDEVRVDQGAEIVAITPENSHVLALHLSDWLPDVAYEQPMLAWVESGSALGVCSSVRLTHEAAAAGVEVTPAARQRGIGRAVVQAWAGAVQEAGKIAMYSTSSDNVASQNLAASLGLSYLGSDFHISASA